VNLLSSDHVKVVQDKGEGGRGGGDFVEQAGEKRLAGEGLGRLQGGQDRCAEAFMDRLQSGD
jgi:hypothetical protein